MSTNSWRRPGNMLSGRCVVIDTCGYDTTCKRMELQVMLDHGAINCLIFGFCYIFFCKCCQGVLLLVAAILLKMVSVCTDSHQIQNTDEFGRLQWSTPEQNWSGPTEHSMVCSAHFEPAYCDRCLYHQSDLTIKQMLLPDAVPTIFPLSKKAKVPQKKRGAFEKRERIRVSLSRIVLTWTWSCHGWRNTVACALSLCVHCHCHSVVHNVHVHVGLHILCVIVNTTCDYVGAHSPTKYGVHLIISESHGSNLFSYNTQRK